jgi:hypothetical protein
VASSAADSSAPKLHCLQLVWAVAVSSVICGNRIEPHEKTLEAWGPSCWRNSALEGEFTHLAKRRKKSFERQLLRFGSLSKAGGGEAQGGRTKSYR